MLLFNHYPPQAPGDISISDFGKRTLESYAENATVRDSIDPTYQRLRGAAEAIGGIVTGATQGRNFDQIVAMVDTATDALEMPDRAKEILSSHIRRVIMDESGVQA